MSKKKKKPEAVFDNGVLRGEPALLALAAEARKRRTTYGKLVASLDNEEMIRICREYQEARAGKKRRKKIS